MVRYKKKKKWLVLLTHNFYLCLSQQEKSFKSNCFVNEAKELVFWLFKIL